MNQNNKIGIATEELYRIFEILNNKYFEGKLEAPIITIQKGKKSNNLGWFSTEKIWTNKAQDNKKHEINVSAEHLKDDVTDIVETVLHECCHYQNKVLDIKDCNGQIHNKKFKSMAEKVGLLVERDKKVGWGYTSCSAELKQFITDTIKPNGEAFSYFRTMVLDTGKASTPREKTIFKYTCPQCGEEVKAKKDKNIICGDCKVAFKIEEE
jgi:predicted RNA-binding Zn-ribbon protein involved in translation (DUF1610 family)